MLKTLFSAAIAATALTSLSAAAQNFNPTAPDACNPEAWNQFGYAVENRDYDLLAQMMNDAEYKVCTFYATAELLYCQQNPQDCYPPAGGPDDDPDDDPNDDPRDDPQDDPQDEPEDPLGGDTKPGEHIGTENDSGGDDGGNDDGGNDDGGNDDGGNDDGGNDGAGNDGRDGNSIGPNQG